MHRMMEPVAFTPDQEGWNRLIAYALRCVEAESARAIAPLDTRPGDPPWYPLRGPEALVTGRADFVRAPAELARRLDGRRTDLPETIACGWPAVVTRNPDTGRLGVAPLFVVFAQPDRRDGAWTLAATTEPEFNLAALAASPERAAPAAEIAALPLPFGDPAAFAKVAVEAGVRLGFPDARGQSFNPDETAALAPAARPGVWNAAVAVIADRAGFFHQLHRELQTLSAVPDWHGTAAALLIGAEGAARREPSSPLAAPLRVNRSQREALDAMRTEPLSVVIGPPGTGKTQLVANAVANAWLDGETVLVTSTNNAAVDVAAERARRDIAPGLLVRTGNRNLKTQVAAQVSTAASWARSHDGLAPDAMLPRLTRTARERQALTAHADAVSALERELLRAAQRHQEAYGEWRRAAARLWPGNGARLERAALLAEWIDGGLRAAAESVEAASERAAHHRGETAEPADAARAEAWRAVDRAASALWSGGDSRAPAPSGGDAERLARKASRLETTFWFRQRRQRALRARLQCADGAPMREIGAWARAVEEWRARESDWAACDAEQRRLDGEHEAARAEMRLAAARSGAEADATAIALWRQAGLLASGIGDEIAKLNGELRVLTGDARSERPEAVEPADREWTEASRDTVRATVAECISRAEPGSVPAFSSVSPAAAPFAHAVKRAMSVYRGWASTSLSLAGNFPLEAGLFGLVIVDEASQCGVASVIPAAYRARRLAVVGDPNQLRPIATAGAAVLRRIARECDLEEDNLRERGLHHRDGSAYGAFEYALRSQRLRQPHLLSEHYRCHPHIAKWFNEAFYGGELVVLTDTSGFGGGRALTWRDEDAEAIRPERGGGWVNDAQAKAAADMLLELMGGDEDGLTAAVVTPYAAQADLIEREVKRRISEERLAEADLVCGTAHRLQGAERDVVVFSSVLSPSMPGYAAAWIERERHLLNVAASRARRTLAVIGHPGIDAGASPTLFALREHIRNVTESGTRGLAPAAFAVTASGAEKLAFEAMRARGLNPLAKMTVGGYELDFALIDGGARLNVEIDGKHHADRGADGARDAALAAEGWRVLRLPAWRCYSEPDAAAVDVAQEWEQARRRFRMT